MALPFSPAGAHGAVRSAGAFGGILVTVVLALGVLRLAGTESVSVTYWGSAFARPADQRGDAVATAEFTGQFDNGVPVYRLPAIQIADVRAKR
jgi:hypothetical protein